MSLHPIKALDHVIAEYRDYLRTEFRAKDLELRAALERELDAPRFLAQEPFYQAHRPFKQGKPWSELPIDRKLAEVMEARTKQKRAYPHQSEAIEELLSPARLNRRDDRDRQRQDRSVRACPSSRTPSRMPHVTTGQG